MVTGSRMASIEAEYIGGDPIYDTNLTSLIRKLPFSERRLLILYGECGSIVKLSKIYNCDRRTLTKQINRIRNKFKDVNKYD